MLLAILKEEYFKARSALLPTGSSQLVVSQILYAIFGHMNIDEQLPMLLEYMQKPTK